MHTMQSCPSFHQRSFTVCTLHTAAHSYRPCVYNVELSYQSTSFYCSLLRIESAEKCSTCISLHSKWRRSTFMGQRRLILWATRLNLSIFLFSIQPEIVHTTYYLFFSFRIIHRHEQQKRNIEWRSFGMLRGLPSYWQKTAACDYDQQMYTSQGR
jgi:hypothetical protein